MSRAPQAHGLASTRTRILLVVGAVVVVAGAVVGVSRLRTRHAKPADAVTATAATARVVGATAGDFAVAFNGTAVYEIPMAVPPGTRAMQPHLSLNYSTQQPDGIVGVGWTLSGLSSIVRCGATILQDDFAGGVGYDQNDRFCLLDPHTTDGRLVPVDATQSSYFVAGATYRTEKDNWTQVVAGTQTCGGGPCSFQVTLRDGTVLGFGTTTSAQVAAVAATATSAPPAGAIRTWLLDSITDLNGNTLQITYTATPKTTGGTTIASTGQAYPSRIDYTSNTGVAPMRSVQLYYAPRVDATTAYEGGAQIQNAALLSTIQTCISTSTAAPVTALPCAGSSLQLVKQYQLTYAASPITGRSRLAAVQECDGAGGCFPPTVMTWSDGPSGLAASSITATGISNNNGFVADFNGDGKTDLLSLQVVGTACPASATAALFFATGQGFGAKPSCLTIPITQSPDPLIGDFNGDGLADLLLASPTSGTLYFATGNGFGAGISLTGFSLDAQQYVADVNGDGMADLVTANAAGGNLYLSNGNGFAAAVPFSGVSLGQGQTWLADFSGDGRADLLSAGPSSATLYLSTGSGFAAGISSTGLNLFANSTLVGDFNGDSLPDLLSAEGGQGYLSYGNGRGFQPPITIPKLQLQQGQTWISDFNGDGWMDIYSAGTTTGTIYYSTRSGFASAAGPGQPMQANATWIGDFNGDGAADLYVPAGTGDHIYFAAQGGAVLSANQAPDLMTNIIDGIGGQTTVSYQPLTNSAVYSPQTSWTSGQVDAVLVARTGQHGPLPSLQVPLYGTRLLDNALYVVASYVRSNVPAVNASAYMYLYSYFYNQSLYSLLGRGWLGFASVTVDDTASGAAVTTSYRQDYPYEGQVSETLVCAASGTTATPCTPASQGGTPLRVSTRTYACQDTMTSAACQVNNQQYSAAATRLAMVLLTGTTDQDTTLGSKLQVGYGYDQYGNATLTSNLGDVANTSNPVYTCQQFVYSTNPWAVTRLQTSKVSASSSCANIAVWNGAAGDLRLFRRTYDSHLNLASEVHWDSQNSIWLGAQFSYDETGNQTSDTQLSGTVPALVPGSTFTTQYDATYHTFPQVRTTPAPSASDPASKALVTTFAYDPRFGQLLATQDPNGNILNHCPDSFGREAATQGPAQGATPAATNCLTAASFPTIPSAFTNNSSTATLSRVAWSASGGAVTRRIDRLNAWGATPSWLQRTAYIDGLKRLWRAQTLSDNAAPIDVDTQYQTESLVHQVSLPYLPPATPAWIVNQYDPTGRLLKQTAPYQAPSGAIATSEVDWTYSAPNQMTETRIASVGGNYVVTSSFGYYDDSRKIVSRAVMSDGGATTTYGYDLLGSLLTSTAPAGAGPAGAVTDIATYDSLGRRVSHQQTNMGTLSTFYSSVGTIDHEIDSKGQKKQFTYDALHRPVGTTLLDSDGVPVQVYTFTYDRSVNPAASTNEFGALASVVVSDSVSPYLGYAFGYDAYGNQTARSVELRKTEQAYVITRGFDPQGREVSRAFGDPKGSVVTRSYSAAGNLQQMAYANKASPTPTPYVTYSGYTPFSAPQKVQYRNGDTELLRYDVAGRPWSRTLVSSSGRSAGTPFEALVYGWDTLGNLVSITDCNYQGNATSSTCAPLGTRGTSAIDLGEKLAFTSNRLTQATGPFGASAAQSTLAFGYDQAGNITSSGGVAYTYAGHQVVAGTAADQQVFQALYDANGNMYRKSQSGTTQLYTFDVRDRLASVQVGGATVESYQYDDEGQRVQKTIFGASGTAPSANVYYVDPAFEVTVPTSGPASYSIYLDGVRSREAVLTWSGATATPTVSFLHKDHAGSTVLRTDSKGAVASQAIYSPYGVVTRITPTGSMPPQTLFQGKELDGSGMYHVGARVQDPALGRFISADSDTSVYAQDGLNRYAFALNNPAVVGDPSGRTPLNIVLTIFLGILDVFTDGIAGEVELDAQLIYDSALDRWGNEAQARRLLQIETRERLELLPPGRVTARQMARSAAAKLKETGLAGRRAKLSVAITRNYIYADVSGDADGGDALEGDGELSTEMARREAVIQRYAATNEAGRGNYRLDSFKSWSVRNCSEFRICNQMALNGESMADLIEMHTVRLGDLLDAPRCENCRFSTFDAPVRKVTSDLSSFGRSPVLRERTPPRYHPYGYR